MLNSTNTMVSSESEELILVDASDNELGFLSKEKCHDGEGVMHRAFSLFVFNDEGELLLQKRSAKKRLWPLFWSNSCCSHPRRGESIESATRRRLREELGIEAKLEYVYKFAYQVQYEQRGSENELCSVFLGRTDQVLSPNVTEIAEARYIDRMALQTELDSNPDDFTPWFKMEWERLCDEFASELALYAK